MPSVQAKTAFLHHQVIADICDMQWSELTTGEIIDAAWAYYFFSVQFRENLEIARQLFPADDKLQELERGECNTDNLSPWPGVASAGERLDHDEFMRRLLRLTPISEYKRRRFTRAGEQYLTEVRKVQPLTRALSLASYEDGGLERVFRAMLQSPDSHDPLIRAFRHFLSEHVRFDSDADEGHGALIRHLQPDDRIFPLWLGFKHILIEFAPSLQVDARLEASRLSG